MSWQVELAAALDAGVASAEPVSGGDINDAYRVQLDDQRVAFVKTHARAPAGMFVAEAAGLDWLRGDHGLYVPRVLAVGTQFLALEWLDLAPQPPRDFDRALGRGLAALHRLGAPRFGLDGTSFLATLPQDNGPAPDGVTFWIERRLRPLAERAHRDGRMPDPRVGLDALLARRDRFGPEEAPARLHGDLWWGNVVVANGGPAIIDPAVYGGHREVDLAMLALFGSLPQPLVDAYDERYPLAAGWRDRIGLWQLYPLAAHAVLFGGGYGARFARTLAALT